MAENQASAKRRILNALKKGARITSWEANQIDKTSEGGRRIREIRLEYPVLKEAVPNSRQCRYYLDPEYLRESRKSGVFRKLFEFVGEIFN